MTAAVELRMPLGYVEMDTEEMEYLEGGGTYTIVLSKGFLRAYYGCTCAAIGTVVGTYVGAQAGAIVGTLLGGMYGYRLGKKVNKSQTFKISKSWIKKNRKFTL